jgi:hypothetical protein
MIRTGTRDRGVTGGVRLISSQRLPTIELNIKSQRRCRRIGVNCPTRN